METQTKTSAKDFFVNLGAIIALGMVIGNLLDLLFTIINKAYPVTTGYFYYGSYSISWPVATLIIFFPAYILLMWLLERGYRAAPEKRNLGVRKWLTYITLFLAGLAFATDLAFILYYFLDGRDLTTGFLLKAFCVLVISFAVFFYYITDTMGKQTSSTRATWTAIALIVIVGAVGWGFSVLGSPRTQQLLKYDEQRVNDLINLNSQIQSYYSTKNVLPISLKEMEQNSYYLPNQLDPQTKQPYVYQRTGETAYSLCAVFNKKSEDNSAYDSGYYPGSTLNWAHPAGYYCFPESASKPAVAAPPYYKM